MQRKHVSNLRSVELPSQFKETNLWEHCPVNPSLAFFKSFQDLKAECLCFIIITDWIQTLPHDARRRYTSVCRRRAGATTTTPAAQTPAAQTPAELVSFQPVIREAPGGLTQTTQPATLRDDPLLCTCSYFQPRPSDTAYCCPHKQGSIPCSEKEQHPVRAVRAGDGGSPRVRGSSSGQIWALHFFRGTS